MFVDTTYSVLVGDDVVKSSFIGAGVIVPDVVGTRGVVCRYN